MKLDVDLVPVQVPGFRFAGVRAGIKQSGKRDVGVICSDVPATAVAAFTSNRVKAAPVRVGIEKMAAERLQAIVINSGNANAYTGPDGLQMAHDMCALVGKQLGIDPALVIPSSTGRIGVPMPRRKVEQGVRQACREVAADGFHAALEAIMTTDAFPKFGVERLEIDGRVVTIAAMAKGAGMIAPRMRRVPPAKHATMLAYVMTDAAVSAAALRQILDRAQPRSFNAIVVDGDTSTNDTVVLMANGVAGNRPLTPAAAVKSGFSDAVARLMRSLARMIVLDGEGAHRVVDVEVRGAKSAADAERAADAIARSPLCKTAFHGSDPYMGRVICALGYSGAVFEPDAVDIYLEDLQVVRQGVEVVGKVEKKAHAILQRPELKLTIDLHAGQGRAERMMSDLGVEYVQFNADYRT